MADITVQDLLTAGVHFGHQTHRWNPKMAPYLFGERAGVHIIDLDQTLGYLQAAQDAARATTAKGEKILFVGTKRQGKEAIRSAAEAAGMPYVTERWLGGLLTNFGTIRTRLELLERLTAERAAGDWERLPKKEVARKLDTLEKLENVLGGILDLERLPGTLFIGDVVREDLAIKEANKLSIPVIGVVDSNADPRGIDHPIPGNDDAVRAIQLVAQAIGEAAAAGVAEHQKTQAAPPQEVAS